MKIINSQYIILGVLLVALLGYTFSLAVVEAIHVSSHNQAPGAIFTTTPDGGIVNENVHYTAKKEVYLDGGPPPNAPAGAAGLPEGDYVFQITDPSGHLLLSEDPSKCRVLHVNSAGVIDGLVDPTTLKGLGGIDLPLSSTYDSTDCHIPDDPTPPTAALPTDAGMSEQHDTNVDVDHGVNSPDPEGAIVVQMMPFLDTPNPGGVYKAWITPYETYLVEGLNCDGFKGRDYKRCNEGDLSEEQHVFLLDSSQTVKVRGKFVGFKPDAGFGPSNHESKTDNFKVVEERPPVPPQEFPMLHVIKFHDLNADGIRDFTTEPSIGPGDPVAPFTTNICVDINGNIVDCEPNGGGFMISITDPAQMQNEHATPVWIIADVEGDWTVEEHLFTDPEWFQSVVFIGDTSQGITNPVTVNVPAANMDPDDIFVTFGNYLQAELHGLKFEDFDGDGIFDDGTDIGLNGVVIELLDDTPAVIDTTTTMNNGTHDGVFWFNGLDPGDYTVREKDTNFVGNGGDLVASTSTSSGPHTIVSGQELNLGYIFGNFFPAEIHGLKFEDLNANGVNDDEPPLADVTITLTGTDGMGGGVNEVTQTVENGEFWFMDLKPGDYTVTETVPPGFVATTPVAVNIILQSGDINNDTEFGNFGPCLGLTPGFWKNWDNHYTEPQFKALLQGTIADVGNPNEDLVAAIAIFAEYNASDPQDLSILKAFVLANELTLNLTNSGAPNLFMPTDGGSLSLLCFAPPNSTTLGEALEAAIAIIDGAGATDEEILMYKDILDAIANL